MGILVHMVFVSLPIPCDELQIYNNETVINIYLTMSKRTLGNMNSCRSVNYEVVGRGRAPLGGIGGQG